MTISNRGKKTMSRSKKESIYRGWRVVMSHHIHRLSQELETRCDFSLWESFCSGMFSVNKQNQYCYRTSFFFQFCWCLLNNLFALVPSLHYFSNMAHSERALFSHLSHMRCWKTNISSSWWGKTQRSHTALVTGMAQDSCSSYHQRHLNIYTELNTAMWCPREENFSS